MLPIKQRVFDIYCQSLLWHACDRKAARRFGNPGAAKGGAPPKGRQYEDAAVADVQALLGDWPRNRDLQIEFLQLLQDAYGHRSAQHLRALAHEMRPSIAEI